MDIERRTYRFFNHPIEFIKNPLGIWVIFADTQGSRPFRKSIKNCLNIPHTSSTDLIKCIGPKLVSKYTGPRDDHMRRAATLKKPVTIIKIEGFIELCEDRFAHRLGSKDFAQFIKMVRKDWHNPAPTFEYTKAGKVEFEENQKGPAVLPWLQEDKTKEEEPSEQKTVADRHKLQLTDPTTHRCFEVERKLELVIDMLRKIDANNPPPPAPVKRGFFASIFTSLFG